jgi:hypothetical protein
MFRSGVNIDFGVAKASERLHGERGRTQFGALLGAYEYISPNRKNAWRS